MSTWNVEKHKKSAHVWKSMWKTRKSAVLHALSCGKISIKEEKKKWNPNKLRWKNGICRALQQLPFMQTCLMRLHWRVKHLSSIAAQRLSHVRLRGRRQPNLQHHVRAARTSAFPALDDLFAWMRLPALSLIALVRPSFQPGGNAHCLAQPDVPLLWNSLQHNILSPQPANALSCSQNAHARLLRFIQDKTTRTNHHCTSSFVSSGWIIRSPLHDQAIFLEFDG